MVARNASPEERREYWRAWYAANREERRRKNHEYRETNKEKIRRREAEFRRRNHDAENARSRDYAARHRQEARDRAKAWYDAHNDEAFREKERQRARQAYATDEKRREYQRRYQRENAERHRQYVHVSRARRRGAPGEGVTAAQWKELVAQYNGRCAYCGVEAKMTIDHRISLFRGGRHELANLLPACKPCNSRKRTMSEEGFRALLACEAARQVSEVAARYSSHLRKALRSWGRPRNSLTSVSAGFVPPWPSTMSRYRSDCPKSIRPFVNPVERSSATARDSVYV